MLRLETALIAAYCVLTAAVYPAVLSEPEADPERSEGEGQPESQGEPEGHPESSTTEPPFAEPVPNWRTAKSKWGLGWEIHIYLFGAAFGVVALYALVSTIRLWKKKHLLSQSYFIALNSLIFIMAASRSVYLLYDAYNSHGGYPMLASALLYSIVFPCMTSAFSLLFLALLAATQMKFMPPSIQRKEVIIVIIIIHFTMSIASDIVLGYFAGGTILLFVCQVFNVVWGFFLFIGFLTIFKRLYDAAKARQQLMNKYTLRKFGLSVKQHSKPHRLTLSLAVTVTLVVSIMGLVTASVYLYGIIDLYFALNPETPEAWEWWIYHTALRFCELVICITISYIATQPFRYPSRGDEDETSNCSCFLCAPCWSFCHKENRYLLPDTEWSGFSEDQDRDPYISRNESQKGDYPLHLIRQQSTEPTSPTSTVFKTPMLKANKGQLQLCSDDPASVTKLNIYDADTVENPCYYHSDNNMADQSTLKIERELQQDINSETDNLLSVEELGASREELNRIKGSHSITQSLDRVSQMSPEVDLSSDEDHQFTADV